MTKVRGPITVVLEINGAHESTDLAKLLFEIGCAVERILNTEDFGMNFEFGRNN